MATTKTKPAPKSAATKAKPAPKSKATGERTTKTRTAVKTAPKSAPKAKAAPKAAPKEAVESKPRGEMNVHGFYDGTDSAIIADALVEGGESRAEVVANATETIAKTSGLATRNGTDKAVASMTSGILNALLAKGYVIEQSYRLVPPADVAAEMKKAAAAEKRAAARKAKPKK